MLATSAPASDDPAAVSAEDDAPAPFSCNVCSGTFTRADHLARHKQSHANNRTFSCPFCPKAFNRVDLLNRHKGIHARSADATVGPAPKRLRRVARACQSCISAKARCDNGKPCSRCRARGQSCITTPHQDPRWSCSQEPASGIADTTITNTTATTEMTTSTTMVTAPAPNADTAAMPQTLMTPITPMPAPTPPPAPAHPHFDNHTSPSILGLVESPVVTRPEPNEHSLFQLASIATDQADPPTGFNPTFFQLDHTFSRDFDFDFTNVELAPNDLFTITDSPGSNLKSLDGHSSASRRFHASRFEAFKKSPWIWSPAEQDSAYAEHDALNVNESRPATLLEIERASFDHPLKVKPLTHDMRDRLLAMVIETSSRVGSKRVPSFPSTTILNGLFQTYFYKTRSQTDQWIHAPSFDPSDCPIQLIGAIVAGGAQYIAERTIWSMGLALLESVRLSLSSMIEADNTWTRNLRSIQTYRLWVDFGLWSGFKRKMEISESFGHIVVTMLRRAGAFRASYYEHQDSLLINSNLEPESVKANWMEWVRLESMKRLTIHTLVHDAQCSIAFSKPPAVSFVEYTLPLPAADTSWLAPTPSQWAATYQPGNGLPLLQDVVQDLRILENLQDHVDVKLTHMIILHGFWAQIWNYQITRKLRFCFKQGQTQAPSGLWNVLQYQEIYRSLTMMRDYYSTMRDPFASELLLTVELFMMFLQVSFLDLQQVAGKAGEREAEQAFHMLQQEWFETREARCAVWHAGQVLHTASILRPTSLRDFNAIAVYQAGLCLWVYGFISSVDSTCHQAATETNLFGHGLGGQFQVILDGPESAEKRNFIEYSQGIPCITMRSPSGNSVVTLKDQRSVMEVVRGLLRDSFPSNCTMPPLVENLSSLMENLSDLASNALQRRE